MGQEREDEDRELAWGIENLEMQEKQLLCLSGMFLKFGVWCFVLGFWGFGVLFLFVFCFA